jgi:hypothetical protein
MTNESRIGEGRMDVGKMERGVYLGADGMGSGMGYGMVIWLTVDGSPGCKY